MKEFDVVVAGLGGVGSFALRALARRSGLKILGIERFYRCHNRGSSHGGSRIYRTAIFEHPSYVSWAQYSVREFESLGDHCIERVGCLTMEDENGSVLKSTQDAAERHGIEGNALSNAELRHRYPQFRITSDAMIGFFEKEAGFVRPELVIEAALAEAEQNGAAIVENTMVEQMKEEEAHVELTVAKDGKKETIIAKKLILTAGAWASSLIPTWRPLLRVTRQLQIYVEADSNMYTPSELPTWLMMSPHASHPLYGFPVDLKGDHPAWMKLSIHGSNVEIKDPSKAPRTASKQETEAMEQVPKLCFNGAFPTASMLCCMYTMSPDENFIVGRPAEFRHVVAAAGLSGHGFKMTPALGAILADLALDEDFSQWKADFVSPTRFGV